MHLFPDLVIFFSLSPVDIPFYTPLPWYSTYIYSLLVLLLFLPSILISVITLLHTYDMQCYPTVATWGKAHVNSNNTLAYTWGQTRRTKVKLVFDLYHRGFAPILHSHSNGIVTLKVSSSGWVHSGVNSIYVFITLMGSIPYGICPWFVVLRSSVEHFTILLMFIVLLRFVICLPRFLRLRRTGVV